MPPPTESFKQGFDVLTVDSCNYLLHRGTDLINNTLRGGKVWEATTLQIAKLFLAGITAPVVLDIGANLGAFAVPIGRHIKSSDGQLFAFEPQRLVYYQLCANLLLNQLGACQALHLAVGDKPGEIEVPALELTECANLGAVSLEATRRSLQWEGSIACIKVPLTTLDSMTQLPAAHLVKIDVEGMELEVLQGGQDYLRRSNYPPLLFEIWGDYEKSFIPKREKLLSLVQQLGYQTWEVGELCVAQHPASARLHVSRSPTGDIVFNPMATAATAGPARAPGDWCQLAHEAWLQGDKSTAINRTLEQINLQSHKKAVGLILQLTYYIFLLGDYTSVTRFLELARQDYPQHPELLLNLAISLSLSGRHQEAIERLHEVIAIEPENAMAYDALSNSLAQLKRYPEASAAGTRALDLKNKPLDLVWQLPPGAPDSWACMPNKKNVIAFSLWGSNLRYLRGAIDNALAAPTLYPGWLMRFYVDESVPLEIRAALAAQGAEVLLEPTGQTIRQRLGWRFKVANDPGVGRFLVRDADSLINERERHAVNAWIASDRWFHIMRDWWTHSELILAGMWGGVAGVLPNLEKMLNAYKSEMMETPNIDQWFLRDQLWPYVRTSCMVHDRCFTPVGALPWPVPNPEGTTHVGQCVFSTQQQSQEKRLAALQPRPASLHLPAV